MTWENGWGKGGGANLRLEDHTDLKACSRAEFADHNGGERCEEEGYRGGVVSMLLASLHLFAISGA